MSRCDGPNEEHLQETCAGDFRWFDFVQSPCGRPIRICQRHFDAEIKFRQQRNEIFGYEALKIEKWEDLASQLT